MDKKAPMGAHPVAPSLESAYFTYLRHENRDSLLIKYRRCIFAGKKAPAGAHLDTPSLESTCFMYLRHRNKGSLFTESRRCIFGGKESPCGSALGRTELRKYMSSVFQDTKTEVLYL